MPKAAVFVALALMLLTGLAIGSLNTLGPAGQPVVAIPQASEANSSTALAFYEGIDWLLASGDASDLRQVVHPGFVDHSRLSDEPGTRDSFEAWLQSMREHSPDVRFTVSEVVAQDGLIAVELEQTGTPASSLAGLPLTYPSGSSGYELLRIDNGVVVERWASPALPGLIEPATAQIGRLENAGWIREPRIQQFDFSPGASVDVPSHKGTVLIVESGSLNLRIETHGVPEDSKLPADTIPALNHPPETLEPGSIRVIEPDARFRLWTSSQNSATVVALTLFQIEPADYNSTSGNDDIVAGNLSRKLLAGGAAIRPDHGPFQLQVGHAIALPGTTIPQHKVNELEMLLVIEGTVEARLDKGWVFSLTENTGLKTENDVAIVGPGQAISAGFNTGLSYTVTGNAPAEFWLITVMPEGNRN